MATSHIVSPPAHWHFALPHIIVSAGAGGAMLAITLLRESQITLSPGHALVLHDPVGLAGERVLAHVYREAARHVVESDDGALPSSASLQWLQARPPLSRVWDAMDALGQRRWRRSHHPHAAYADLRAPRVAEPPAQFTVHPPAVPSLILLSESERIDAIAPTAAARLLTRALRRQWAVLAVTREGPRHAFTAQTPAPRDWCAHVVCQGGALRPVSVG